MAEVVRVKVLVSGIVQGVGYRFFVLEAARELGLSGWVRNLRDGRVEAEIEGDEMVVERLVAAMRRGPRLSRVTDVSTMKLEPSYQDHGFGVR